MPTMIIKRSGLRPLQLVAALGLVALGAAPLAAQTTTEGTVIYACYVPSTGTVYRIKAAGLPDACEPAKGSRPAHVPFQWNEQGLPGPQGPEGPQGPQGEPGPAGTAGSLNLKMYASTTYFLEPGRTVAIAACPTGMKAISGGYRVEETDTPAANAVQVVSSYAVPQTYTGWRVAFYLPPTAVSYGNNNLTGPGPAVAAYAMCIAG